MSKADQEMDRWAKEVKRGAITLAILALRDWSRRSPSYSSNKALSILC
ncbi:MAG: hypothetical protein ACXABV_19605 [Candidatus Thorarchaeota archaeon]